MPETKIRIVFIAHDSSLFGAQRSLLSLLLALDRNKFEPIVIAPGSGPFLDSARQANITCYVAFMERWIPLVSDKSFQGFKWFVRTLPGRVYRLSQLISQLNVDIVYTNTVVNADGAIAASILRLKHIWHLREGVRNSQQISSYLPDFMAPHIIRALSSKIIVNSQWLSRHYFGEQSPAVVVYNGINLSELIEKSTGSTCLRQELGLPGKCRLVVSIGSLDPRKGFDVFIRAAELIGADHEDVYFVIVGNGGKEYTQNLQAMAAERCISDRILFLGWRDDVARIISEIDVLVIASNQEAFGRTAIEGMAHKKPVVATRCGGPEEIVVHNVTGFLVPRGDHNALADYIVQLLQDEDMRVTMGLAGYKRSQELFSEEKYVSELEKILESAVMDY